MSTYYLELDTKDPYYGHHKFEAENDSEAVAYAKRRASKKQKALLIIYTENEEGEIRELVF